MIHPTSTAFFIKFLTLAALGLLLIVATPAWAQEAPTSKEKSMRQVLEAEEEADRLVEEREQSDPKAIDAGATPLATMLGLREAMRASDYNKAGEYLDMRYLPEELDDFSQDQLVVAFALVWSQQNIIDFSAVSDDPKGNLADGLPSYRDQVGSITLSTGELPIYLQRIPDGRGGKVWKLSNVTVARIPEMWEELGYNDLTIYLSEILPDFRFMGMTNWQVVATVLFFTFAWPIASLISVILMKLALLIPNGFPLGIERFFRGPMRFFIFVFLARILMDQLGLSLTARVFMAASGIDFVAYTVLFMGILSLIRDYNIRKMERAGNAHYAALLKPLTTIVKVLVITCIALVWADSPPLLAGSSPACVPTLPRSTGSRITNIAPPSGRFSGAISPLWSLMMPKLTDSPRPVPFPPGLVVKKGSNSRSRCSCGIPGPVSEMRISIRPSSSARASTVTRPGSPPMACWAFMIMFISTCCS